MPNNNDIPEENRRGQSSYLLNGLTNQQINSILRGEGRLNTFTMILPTNTQHKEINAWLRRRPTLDPEGSNE